MELNLGAAALLLVEDESQVGHARRVAQQLALTHGLDETDRGRVALVVTELASNLLKHASRGEIQLCAIQGRHTVGIEVRAVDRGPGFDPVTCLRDGYSSGGSQGIGLGAVERQAEVFDLYSDARGSVLLARIYPRGSGADNDLAFGASQRALHDNPACGDGWNLLHDAQGWRALVVDGLGHGAAAAQAATAGMAAFAAHDKQPPNQQLERLHQAMRSTRGGAAAIAQYDYRTHTLRFAGLGNIGASLHGVARSRGLTSLPGIVGDVFRSVPVQDYPDAGGQLLIMHSDGLQSRWRLEDYPGLACRHPSTIAATLHRDFSRGRDDATILVVALGDA